MFDLLHNGCIWLPWYVNQIPVVERHPCRITMVEIIYEFLILLRHTWVFALYLNLKYTSHHQTRIYSRFKDLNDNKNSGLSILITSNTRSWLEYFCLQKFALVRSISKDNQLIDFDSHIKLFPARLFGKWKSYLYSNLSEILTSIASDPLSFSNVAECVWSFKNVAVEQLCPLYLIGSEVREP